MNLLEKDCTGCGLCENLCPQNAIIMSENEEGFLYPVIDKKKCDNCNLCLQICEVYKTQYKNKSVPLLVKACQTINEKWLIESTAGGFFPTLAEWIIKQDGVVFGTAYDVKMKPVVCKAESIEGIMKFNGSKYVQSDLTRAISEVEEELKEGKLVLFSGTPCQVAAVKTMCKEYVGKNLITVEVVCYGVPSPGLFRAFLKTIEKHMKAKIIDYRFRDKHRNGWSHTTVITMVNSNKEKIIFEEEDYSKIPYYKMFGNRNCFRKECYNCQYNTINRISDFTTGNFWGIENMTDKFDIKNGVSMLLINTNQAKKIFEKISDQFQQLDMTIDQAIQANDALIRSCRYPYERDFIYKSLKEDGFETMFKKYYSDTIMCKLKMRFFNIINRFFVGQDRKD